MRWHSRSMMSSVFVAFLAIVLAVGTGCFDSSPPPSGGGDNDGLNVGEQNHDDPDAGPTDDAEDNHNQEVDANQGISGECPGAGVHPVGDDDDVSTSVQVEPGETLRWVTIGDYNPEDRDLVYEWTVVASPDGASASLVPDAFEPEPMLEVDATGDYEVEVDVSGADYLEDCEPASATATVFEADGDVHIQLTWHSPTVEDQYGGPDPQANAGTDLSTHYKPVDTAWGGSESVFYLQMEQNWGDGGQAALDIDDLYGVDPENINHDNIEEGRYSYGVHYYCDNNYGESIAQVRVYFGDQLYDEYTQSLDGTDYFWHVGDVVGGDDPGFDVVDEVDEERPELSSCSL